MGEYVIREYESSDRDDFVSLFADVFGGEASMEWFEWKYEENPYTDGVEMFVAEHDGDLVGARPFFPLEMSIGGDRHLGFPLADTMVHPEHRRQGLFTRMNNAAIERHEDSDVTYFFNFPNHNSRPGYLKLGWEIVAEPRTYYRLQNPGKIVEERFESGAASILGGLADAAVSGYQSIKSRRTAPPDGYTITRHASPPAETLAEIYESSPKGGIHAVRDERFYGYRYGNPGREYATLVAETDGEPVGAVILGLSRGPGVTSARVIDILSTGDRSHDVLEALLDRVVREFAEFDMIVSRFAFDPSLLADYGFLSDERRPIADIAEPTTHLVYPLVDDGRVNGVDVFDPENWNITLAEVDSS